VGIKSNIQSEKLSSPTRLNLEHDVQNFESGERLLDEWIVQRVLRNEREGASRTYVICCDNVVVGYYALSTGSIASVSAPGRVRRNMPDPIPVVLLGRLAIDRRWQGRGLGQALLRDAILRTIQVAEIAGIRAIAVNTISENARQFYEKYDFKSSPIDPLLMILLLKDAIDSLAMV
jgi:GNAT superfamily N-acetyltransferase